jgi:hypothetical protein
MKMEQTMPTRLLALSLLAALLAPAPCPAAETPSTIVARFYTLYLKLGPVGLPTRKQEQAIAPFLSHRLRELFKQARSHQAVFMRKHPDEKPPWADGCLFASLFEGPKRFKMSSVARQADGTSRVTVHFWYDERSAGWEDAVVVREEDGRFVIDDILLSGAGPFNPPGRLSENLKWQGE